MLRDLIEIRPIPTLFMLAEDENEFVDLLTRHQAMIRAFVITLLPGSPGVDDVIQNTNRTLWINRTNFEMGTNFKAWAFTMARFQVMAYRKTLKRQRLVTLDEDVAMTLAQECQEDSDSEIDLHEALKCCLEKLETEDRELILHRYWCKTQLKDFALTSKLSINALKTRLFRIRASLKKCINHRLNAAVPSTE